MADDPTTPRVVLVTGASRGLGKVVAREFASRGWLVGTCSTTREAPGVGEAFHRPTDVTDPAAVEEFVSSALARFHRVDVLINNAGFANASASVAETSDEIALRCFTTNVLGPYYLIRRILPVMTALPGGGVIVNVASRAGMVPVPGLAAYSASKSALVSLTLAVAKELGSSKVLCVSVCTGGMDTEMRAVAYGPESARGQLDPLRVASVVVELATERSLEGRPVRSGAAVLVTKESGITVMEWPRDERGHERLSLS